MMQEQLSIWDIEIPKKPSSITKIAEKVTEIKVLDTKKSYLYTEQQDKIIKNYKEHLEVNRIIQYCGGGLGVEFKQDDSLKTIYVNKDGKEEFTKDKKLPVLPMDKIFFYKEELKANEIQEQRLKEIKDNIIRTIKRKGDENIILELMDKVISINPLGWVLEFNNCKAIYEDDEVINKASEKPKDKKAIGEGVKIGDIVQAYRGKEIIQGEIIREYGINNQILNIIFDNGKKHTAIGRRAVIDILQQQGNIGRCG